MAPSDSISSASLSFVIKLFSSNEDSVPDKLSSNSGVSSSSSSEVLASGVVTKSDTCNSLSLDWGILGNCLLFLFFLPSTYSL